MLTSALENLSLNYENYQLKANPLKQRTMPFCEGEAERKLWVRWEGKIFEQCVTPKYLGIILDQILIYKKLCINTR